MRQQTDRQQMDRQEAVGELFKGESDLVADLQMLCGVYRESICTLGLLAEDKVLVIFGGIEQLIPVHKNLVGKLAVLEGRGEIGGVLLGWVGSLRVYEDYCRKRVGAKDVYDSASKHNTPFKDFLERCLSSPFSRKLDLWTLLDSPRSRLVKYPLLLKSILKHTPPSHPDHPPLTESIKVVEGVIRGVDVVAGEARCAYMLERIDSFGAATPCLMNQSRSHSFTK